MGNPVATSPSALVHASMEDLTFGVDCSANTSAPAIVSVTLSGPGANGPQVTLADDPSVSGTVISQRIRASVLAVSPQPYQLVMVYADTATTNVFAALTFIACPI